MKFLNKSSIRHFLIMTCSALMISTPVFAGHSLQGPSGGTGGTAFTDWGAYNEKMRLIYVRSGSWIDSVHTQFRSSGGVLRWTPHRGGFGGALRPVIVLAPNEFITSVTGYFSGYVRYLRITTTAGNTRTFGNPVGRYFSYVRPGANYKFAGFRGASGRYLDSVGAIWRRK